MALTALQKQCITQMMRLVASDKKTCEKILLANGWNLERAVNAFWEQNETIDPALDKLFDKYRDSKETPDTINMEGTMSYLNDLGLELDNIGVLVVSEIVQSPSIGELERKGFTSGWTPLNATTIASQRSSCKSLSKQITQPDGRDRFRRVYKHTFQLALPTNTRTVPLEDAVEYWKLLFGTQGVKWNTETSSWLDWWLEYLPAHWKKAVNKDMWNQTLAFAEKSLEDESMVWWSEDSAWPGVIDEFVAWVQNKRSA